MFSANKSQCHTGCTLAALFFCTKPSFIHSQASTPPPGWTLALCGAYGCVEERGHFHMQELLLSGSGGETVCPVRHDSSLSERWNPGNSARAPSAIKGLWWSRSANSFQGRLCCSHIFRDGNCCLCDVTLWYCFLDQTCKEKLEGAHGFRLDLFFEKWREKQILMKN